MQSFLLGYLPCTTILRTSYVQTTTTICIIAPPSKRTIYTHLCAVDSDPRFVVGLEVIACPIKERVGRPAHSKKHHQHCHKLALEAARLGLVRWGSLKVVGCRGGVGRGCGVGQERVDNGGAVGVWTCHGARHEWLCEVVATGVATADHLVRLIKRHVSCADERYGGQQQSQGRVRGCIDTSMKAMHIECQGRWACGPTSSFGREGCRCASLASTARCARDADWHRWPRVSEDLCVPQVPWLCGGSRT